MFKKKKIEEYLYFYFTKMIFAFLSRYETRLYISVIISCNFQICKYDEVTTSLLPFFHFIYKIEHSILIFLQRKLLIFFFF